MIHWLEAQQAYTIGKDSPFGPKKKSYFFAYSSVA